MDRARIRTIVTAEHCTAQLNRWLAAFGKLGRELESIVGKRQTSPFGIP